MAGISGNDNKTLKGIVCGDDHLAPQELETRIRQAAGGLRQLGVSSGDSVALLLRNDIPFIVASRATAYLGAYAVPVNWHLSSEEIAYILGDCNARALVVHADLWAAHRDAIAEHIDCIVVETPRAIQRAYALEASACQVPDGVRNWHDWLRHAQPATGEPSGAPVSMIYTSGTTGKPKGVRRPPPEPEKVAERAAFVARVFGCGPGTRCMVPGPLYHSAPNGYAMYASRLSDLLVLQPRFDAEQFLALVDRYALTGAIMAPILFIRLLKLSTAARARHDIGSLDFIVHGAAPCPPDVKRDMIQWFGPIINEYYGSTESGVITVCTAQEGLDHPGTVGRVVPEASVRVLDEDGNQVPAGQIGEVYSRFDGTDFTYNGKPEARAAIDVDDHITSGDMGYFDDDGFLYLCDRAKDMIISGGVNIYPAEIENVLHACPGVRDCAVFGIPDEEYGEAVMAVLEPEPGTELDPEQVRVYLRQHLAGFKVPGRMEIGHDLPREDSGKIFKRRLRERYWEQVERQI